MATAIVGETLLKRDLGHIRSWPRVDGKVGRRSRPPRPRRPTGRRDRRCGDRNGKSSGPQSMRGVRGDLRTVTWAIVHTGGRSESGMSSAGGCLGGLVRPHGEVSSAKEAVERHMGHGGLTASAAHPRPSGAASRASCSARAGPAPRSDPFDRPACAERSTASSDAHKSDPPRIRGRATVMCRSPVIGGEGRSAESAAPRTARRDRRGRQCGVR
jgi:hypothetical protein